MVHVSMWSGVESEWNPGTPMNLLRLRLSSTIGPSFLGVGFILRLPSPLYDDRAAYWLSNSGGKDTPGKVLGQVLMIQFRTHVLPLTLGP